MTNKSLKKEYDKKLNRIMLRLNMTEKAVLTKMMDEEDWTNVAGFVKYKLFGRKPESKYKQMKRSSETKDINIIMQGLMDEMNREIAYLNYRFNYELENIEHNQKSLTEKTALKILRAMTNYKNAVLERTESFAKDCEEILHFIDINIKNTKPSDLESVPEPILRRIAAEKDDDSSPEALELTRRIFERYHKEVKKQLNIE